MIGYEYTLVRFVLVNYSDESLAGAGSSVHKELSVHGFKIFMTASLVRTILVTTNLVQGVE